MPQILSFDPSLFPSDPRSLRATSESVAKRSHAGTCLNSSDIPLLFLLASSSACSGSMANSHEGLGPNTSSGAPDRPRQDPVSCESCRRRKQKCSREQPCSNCASRGVECVFVGGKAPPATAPRTTVSNDICSLRSENAAIKARLDALEELVLNSDLHPAIFGSPERPAKVRRVAQSDVTIPTPDSTLSSRSDQDQAKPYQDELERLGSVGCRENTRLPQLSTDFDIRIGTVQQIVHRIARNWQERCIFLPTETQSLQLFHSYVDQVDPMVRPMGISPSRT